jgi:serine phosphatase RsbU (regulator of sigma subunit)
MTLDPDEGIWRLANALSAAMTPHDVASALAQDGAVVAGASFSNMALLDAEARRVLAVHPTDIDPEVARRWSEFDLAQPIPMCDAMRTGLPILIESIDEMAIRFPLVIEETRAAGLNATASFPLTSASGEMLGAAAFGWSTPLDFGVERFRRLDLITHMAAQALERAVLYERERERAALRERADALLLQDAFLPRDLPKTDSLDVAAVYLPASHATVGGDWYDVFEVDGGICLVIGDVTGHGVQSASAMGQLRNTLRAYAVEDPSPASILNRLNRMMCRLEPGVHASAAVAVWDERQGTLLRANAGHPPVLRCREGEFGYLYPPQGRLLGVTPEWEYGEEIKVMRPGTTLFFYTDGLIEWRDRSLDEGMDTLLEFAQGLRDLAPQALCDAVLQWRLRAGRLEDDVCALAARLR